MSSTQLGQGIHPPLALGSSIEAASSILMGDDMLQEYEDPHPPPSEAVDDLSTAFSSPTKEFLTRHSANMGKSAAPLEGDGKRFQAETQRFLFLARPQTPDSAPAAFTFSAPKPAAGKYTKSKEVQPKLSPVLTAEKVNGESISTRSGTKDAVRSPLQSPPVPDQCSPPPPNLPDLSEKAPKDVLESIEFPDPQYLPPTFTQPQPDSISNQEVERHTDNHKPASSRILASELTTMPLAPVSAEYDASDDQRRVYKPKLDRVKNILHLQRPMLSRKIGHERGSTRVETPQAGSSPADNHQKLSTRAENSNDLAFPPPETRPAESQFRITKSQAKARAKRQKKGSQPLSLRREAHTPLSEEDLLEMMTSQLHERKATEAASQAATEQLQAQIGALTEAYNDAYQKWHDSENLCKEQTKVVTKYQNKCNGWKERVSGFQRFMIGLQNDMQTQFGESKKVREEILFVRQAEQTIKRELAVVREQAQKECQQSSINLVDTKKKIQDLEQHLKESRDSSDNSLRLLSAEQNKVAQLERVIDKQNQKHDTQFQTFQSTHSALVEKLAEIMRSVRECKESIMEGRKEGLPYLKKCKLLLEAMYEEDSVDPEIVNEIKDSILSLSNSIESHLRDAEKEMETNLLSKQPPSTDFEARFSELYTLLKKNNGASERMASLQETHRKLEAQLYASENALTVAQYEIADRDSRCDLLKRRNLDLETNLKVSEDWELKCGEEIARNEELNHQISLLQEALKEDGAKIVDLEEEFRTKGVEMREKMQEIDEISERLQKADVGAKSLRKAIEADYEKKCEEMNRKWIDYKSLEKAEEICDLRNKLNQESNSKKSAEKEVEDLRTSLTKFRENDTVLKTSLKKANSQLKDIEIRFQAKEKESKESLQSKDADIQLLRESSDSKSTAIKEAQVKLATRERELEELKIKCGQVEMTLEKSSAESQRGSRLRADLEKKGEQVHRLEAEHSILDSTIKAVEQAFRRMGLLHPMEIFDEEAMVTVGERISILQLHEAQGLLAAERQFLEEPEQVLSDDTSGQLAKPRRKANRSNNQRVKSSTSLGQSEGPEQADATTQEAQIQTKIVEHQFQGVVSKTMRVDHSTPPRNKASGPDKMMAGPSIPSRDPAEWTPNHYGHQRGLPTGSSPLSNLRSPDVQTPSAFRNGPQRASLLEGINGTPVQASPLAPRENPPVPRTVLQSSAIKTVIDSPEKMAGSLSRRNQEASRDDMDENHGDGKKSTATYQSSRRSILKDSQSPSKRKRSSADNLESQILEKRVRVDAPPSQESDGPGKPATSKYFESNSGATKGSRHDNSTLSKTAPATKSASTQNSSKPRAQAQPPRTRKQKHITPTTPNPFAPRRSTRTSSKEHTMYGDRFSKENPYRA